MNRRSVLTGTAATTVAPAVTPTLLARRASAATQPLPFPPLPPLRIPQLDMRVEQQPDEKIRWLQDSKIGHPPRP
jgi:alpha-L-fucosidase